MLPPKLLSTTNPQKSRAPGLWALDGALTKELAATIGNGTPDSEFSHQRFRNLLYVEFVGPRKTLSQLRNLCLDWLQPETRSKEEIVELLVLEQFLAILPERVKPWVEAQKPESCEQLVTLLENYEEEEEMFQPEDDEVHSDDDFSRVGTESPPPRSEHSFGSDQRGRSRVRESREHWPYARTYQNRPPRDLSLPLPLMERDDDSDRDSMMDFGSSSQEVESYQDVVDFAEERRPHNTVQDNMENYRKLLSLGVQLAEDDGHCHMTQGHSSRSRRSAHPSTSRGVKVVPEARKSTHRRGICEDESSHGVIMEKFIRDVSSSTKSGRARDPMDRPQRFPGMLDDDWQDVSFGKRESKSHSVAELSKPKSRAEATVVQSTDTMECQRAGAGESTYEGNACGVIRSVAAAERLQRRAGSEQGEASMYSSNFSMLPRMDTRENPFDARASHFDEAKYLKYTVIHSAPRAESQSRPDGEGPSESKKEDPAPSSEVREQHQKARAKKKYIEVNDHEPRSVIHSPFGIPQSNQWRARPYTCQQCGASFVRSADLREHLKIHDLEGPSGSRTYERSVIRSLAFVDPQTSYAEERRRHQCRGCGKCFITSEALSHHQKIYCPERFHEEAPFGSSVIQGSDRYPRHAANSTVYKCKDCGERFASLSNLRDHQEVHEQECLLENRPCGPSATQTPCSFGDSQINRDGDQLFECPQCGESFINNDFLYEHQKMHEREPFFITRQQHYGDGPFGCLRFHTHKRRRSARRRPAVSKSFRCQVCGQDFTQRSALEEHMKIHAGGGPQEQGHVSDGRVSEGRVSEGRVSEGRVSESRVSEGRVSEGHVSEGRVSEDTVVQGLALTEFQRNQTEEKSYECDTCGETFLNQSDLRDHMRVHKKDKLFSYGTTFVHTSFFTELPGGDGPFYECKQCGKSFIHNTILVKHQQLHVEEAAQEVEANLVVPQEVLRIQGSNLEAAEPEVQAAAEPNLEAAEATGEAEGPDGEAAEPDAEAEQPNVAVEEPDGAGIEDQGERAEEPEGDAEEPNGAGVEDAEEDDEDQEIQVEEPFYDCQECAETFATNSAYREHLKTHARVIMYESGRRYGGSSRYTEQASTSTGAHDWDDEKYFRCDVCGQLFTDRLSLARHQNSHTG